MSAAADFSAMDSQKFNRFHLKTILVSGVGFYTDALDIFIINLAIPMIAFSWFFVPGATEPSKASAMPSIVTSLLKASTQVGTLCGQLVFGYLGDKLGRKATYGLVLAIMIIASFNTSLAADTKGFIGIGGMLIFWRLVLGVGIGGDYPISAVIASEFASVSTRGLMVAAVFSMQGMGILTGCLFSTLLLLILKPTLQPVDSTTIYVSNFDNVWRILFFIGVLPAIAAVYWRLQVPETPRFSAAKGDHDTAMKDLSKVMHEIQGSNGGDISEKYTHITFGQLFGNWKNGKVLFACAMAWFLLDVGFYGVQLNQSDILKFIGYAKGATAYEYFLNQSIGNLILSLCGTVPGYFFTVALIEKMGRIKIQLMGFGILTAIFVVLTIFYHQMKGTIWLVIAFTAANFFFNFGPNTTTFILPAEIFPTKYRSTCHGISAATGKAGAILAAFGFDQIKGKNGENMTTVLAIFTACMIGGFLVTFWVPETKGKSLEELGDAFYHPDLVAQHPAPMVTEKKNKE
uniref:High affinity phosphate transporter n=1 Tax=Blastocladiella emersonii TaxID=4808 RepID=A0A238HJY5_BLAEM|nr:High affinity phosphate transporter [Blastocladiella emersonii]